jgi:hypothetical protein
MNGRFQAHATMGPGCAVADVRARRRDHRMERRPEAARASKRTGGDAGHERRSQVRVIWVEGAGTYGRAGDEDVAADAVITFAGRWQTGARSMVARGHDRRGAARVQR